MQQTMEQKRAKFALEYIKKHLNQTEKAEYANCAKSLPFMIHANGLGQALAFYYSKGEKTPHRLLYTLLSDWLMKQENAGIFPVGNKDLLEAITQSDMSHYLLAQTEAMKLMDWVKKFATAYSHKD